MMSSDAMQQMYPVTHTSDIAAARRCALSMARQSDFDEIASGKLAIMVTESATNILKHAGSGRIILTRTAPGAAQAMEVLALDNGPGIANLAACLRDGMSTTGTAGTGLGAIRRMADHFDVYTMPGKGSAFYMRVLSGAGAASAAPTAGPALEYGAVCVPMRGEHVCGDAWAIEPHPATVLVADGLGHGPDAAEASQAAVQALHAHADRLLLRQIETIHQALAATRGAAVALAQIAADGSQLHFVGIGNISGSILSDDSAKSLISHNGIAGHNMRKVQQFSYPWSREATCIMYSDGLSTHWDVRTYPGLLARHPALIAGVLYRDFSRDRDDATIVVFRQARTV
jgi:anti-sigma regulatory factor (Ser/Thr protein kinase)